MLWGIAMILIVLWAVGLVTSITLGGFIHLLIVAAAVLLMFAVFKVRRKPSGHGSLSKEGWTSVNFKP
jgi:hypothetical protein